jgi:hypothetical protein
LNPLVLLLMGGSGADPSQVTSSLMGRVREHLANIYGTPIGPQRPNKKPGRGQETIDKWKKDIRGFLKQITQRFGSDWRVIAKYLRQEGWTTEEIQQLLEFLRKAGIKPEDYFTNL